MSPIFKRNFKENLYISNLIFYSTILVAHGYHHHSNLLSRQLHNFQDYLDKFGFIFIVFATGKSAQQMLDSLLARLPNDRTTELVNAAAEQNKITRLRLQKLLSDA